MIKLLVLLALISFGQALQNREFLDQNGRVSLEWTVSGTTVTFEIAVATHGFVGFGFSEFGGMVNSDVILGWINAAGQTTFDDRFAVEYAEPVIDDVQNYNLLASSENTTHTVFRFSREVDTGDVAQDRVIESGPIYVIYSFSDVDPADGGPVEWHGAENRGNKIVTIL